MTSPHESSDNESQGNTNEGESVTNSGSQKPEHLGVEPAFQYDKFNQEHDLPKSEESKSEVANDQDKSSKLEEKKEDL